ncbi:hypothetical protein [Arsenicibacter rosenii]|uniref:Phage portal protein n=1 Tax=Arsenicibacter rosenii TaxID=1750698 RepID=A0A1S2VFV1_9BACT|nr:hypothetical protein [Arsenicibacter rosenii]OIN56778.1 hypothetical protein BLX24_22645 [Arsenicibacter rosenii]
MSKKNAAVTADHSPVFFSNGGDYDVAIMVSTGAMFSFETERMAMARAGGSTAPAAGAKPSAAKPDTNLLTSQFGDIMNWGDDNALPQRIIELYNRDPIIPATLGKLMTMLVGRGIMAVQETIDDNGKDKDIRVNDLQINRFLRSIQTKQYLREMSGDLSWFFNGFPEMILSRDRSEIVQIHPLNAEECRYGKMTDAGDLPYVYLSSEWEKGYTREPKQLSAIDPYRIDRVDWLRDSSLYKCVYPLKFPTPGKRVYALPHHYAIVESGWLDVHLAIPTFKKFLLKNQISIKYHWKIDFEYWKVRYGEIWDKADAKKRMQIQRDWITEQTRALANMEKSGVSIVTPMAYDPRDQKAQQRELIKIEEIKDSSKEGKYIEDNLEAAANIFYALGLDPVISGFAGGDKMGSRSGGSDKREGYLIALQMLNFFRDLLLEPIQFVAEYNGWTDRHPDLAFRFKDTILTTLDTGAGSAKKLS